MTHATGRLTAKNRDQLGNPTLGNRVWATFTFLIVGLRGGNNITIADHTRSFDFFPIPIRFLCHNCFYLRQFLFPLQLLFWTRDAMLAQH